MLLVLFLIEFNNFKKKSKLNYLFNPKIVALISVLINVRPKINNNEMPKYNEDILDELDLVMKEL